MGRGGRLIALVAAIALFAVSVQASVLEACSLCPSDCPMHSSEHDGQRMHAAAKAKPRCHNARDRHADDESRFRRPPCKTSFTFAASPLPPFVLGLPFENTGLVPSGAGAGTDIGRPIGRHPSPDTPPPIPRA